MSNGENTATHPDTFENGSGSGFAAGCGTTGFSITSTGSDTAAGLSNRAAVLLKTPRICGQNDTIAPAMPRTTARAATRGSHAFMRGA